MKLRLMLLSAAAAVALSACSGAGQVSPSGAQPTASAPQPTAGAAQPSATTGPAGSNTPAPSGAGAQPTSATSANQPLTHVIFASATASQNPLFENIEIGKMLGYYKEAGIDIEFQYLGSNQAVMAALLSNKAQVGVCTQDYQVTYAAQGNPLDTTCFYEYSYPMKWDFAVLPDSPITRASDLKGATIGLISLGTADKSIASSWLKVAGVDPSTVTFQVVGDQAPAGVALQQKRIDAMLTWDTTLGFWDSAGIKYRVLPRPDGLPLFGGFYLQATKQWLQSNRQLAIGFARAVAKGSVFAQQNPQAAASVYIQMHPEASPPGMTKTEAIDRVVTSISHRTKEWSPPSGTPWGQTTPTEWQNEINLLGVQDKVKDPSVFFTNDLIPEVNQFDANAVKQQASSYKP